MRNSILAAWKMVERFVRDHPGKFVLISRLVDEDKWECIFRGVRKGWGVEDNVGARHSDLATAIRNAFLKLE